MAEHCICSYRSDKVVRHPKCPVHGDPQTAENGELQEGADALRELEAVRDVVKELTSKVQHLVEVLDNKGLLEDHSYTFPDGDVWKAQDVEPK